MAGEAAAGLGEAGGSGLGQRFRTRLYVAQWDEFPEVAGPAKALWDRLALQPSPVRPSPSPSPITIPNPQPQPQPPRVTKERAVQSMLSGLEQDVTGGEEAIREAAAEALAAWLQLFPHQLPAVLTFNFHFLCLC